MSRQSVIQFEFQQSLVQESDRSPWSEKVSVSVRLFAEAITSGWYRNQFSSRGNDFVVLLAIAMHARPLQGDDLAMLVGLKMALPEDAGRLYTRISDVALADELGMSRITIARAVRNLAERKSITILEIPERLTAFRDSHGRFNGTRVYLVAGDILNNILEKNVKMVSLSENKNRGYEVNQGHRGVNVNIPVDHHKSKKTIRVPDLCINLKEEKEEDEASMSFERRVFAYFAWRKGYLEYRPTHKERVALKRLFEDSFSLDQVLTGIDEAFDRATLPRYFTHCAAITRDLFISQQENRISEQRQVSTRKPEALQETDSSESLSNCSIEPELLKAIEVYQSSGRQISKDLLLRFRMMVKCCDIAARANGSTGGDWLADALTRAFGVAQPKNIINYADATLRDWIEHGQNQKYPGQRRKLKLSSEKSDVKTQEPAAHAGIRRYLEEHGGIQSGERD